MLIWIAVVFVHSSLTSCLPDRWIFISGPLNRFWGLDVAQIGISTSLIRSTSFTEESEFKMIVGTKNCLTPKLEDIMHLVY